MERKEPSRESDRVWVGKPVPRYTSYPPAPAFHNGIGSADYQEALRLIGPDEKLSLYVHIPFCRHLCLYCGCHTHITNREERVIAYLDALKKEMALVASALSGSPKVSHLHFGGGSPNFLVPALMRDLFVDLRRHFDFSSCAEIAMEIDPRLVTPEQAETMAACGVTRLSLGVQDFNPDVQEAIARVQPFEQVAHVCAMLRSAGLKNISFDLMYGLPRQTEETILATAHQALSLVPERVSFFSYAHVPQIKPHQKELERYPFADKFALLDQEQAGRGVWESAHYVAVGMDHFAHAEDKLVRSLREKTLRRNFQGYTDDQADILIALGISSIGQTYNAFFQNEKEEKAYEQALNEGRLPTMRGLVRTDEDKIRAKIIEELMCFFSCDLTLLCQHEGLEANAFDAEISALAPFVEAGIIKIENRKIVLTSPRRMAIRVIAHAFDRYTNAKSVASKAA